MCGRRRSDPGGDNGAESGWSPKISLKDKKTRIFQEGEAVQGVNAAQEPNSNFGAGATFGVAFGAN